MNPTGNPLQSFALDLVSIYRKSLIQSEIYRSPSLYFFYSDQFIVISV